ncbi:sugar ABC transporter ATP-binding protein [Baekduia soli]|uniref:Sugar ABC transporter ATP-binding protein n=1 Tax=Baekduia soli TaxID=496014 RepID=A0A5B8UBY8_9ACTN|nr:sugar ABC transporter ATP-binding protein [Baekduia soli]QEC50560.1 sugar ABC transporter ATP-binding protein [Baekduia soli]
MSEESVAGPRPLGGLSIQGLSKTFPGTRALDDVSVEGRRGEVLALLGHNGSGKSTLIKILAGFHQPDPGAHAWVDGQPLDLGDSEAATAMGLRFVHQDLGLIPELNAVDNVALTIGYSRRRGRIDQGQQIARTRELLQKFGVDFDVTLPLANASPVERTCVAIARAMWDWDSGPRILVLDEPTASLPSREVSRLFAVIREVRAAGHAVVYVSHRMEEIFELGDEVVVLRAGRVVGAGPVAAHTPEQLATLIAGHELQAHGHTVTERSDDVVLSVKALRGRYLDGVDVELRRGEVLGVAGLLGSGRDELPYALAGAVPTTDDGGWWIEGRQIDPPTAATAVGLGIGLVPAERGREGLIAEFTVRENLTLGALPALRSKRGGFIWGRSELRAAQEWLAELGVPTAVADRPVSTLSGGNQQRVLFGRCLHTDPKVLVLAEPTAGVDVGARESLYELLRARAREGLSILLASSDTEDLVSMCDRVIVLRRGRVADEMQGAEIDPERIVSVMESVR